jgi:hypothetical protein
MIQIRDNTSKMVYPENYRRDIFFQYQHMTLRVGFIRQLLKKSI